MRFDMFALTALASASTLTPPVLPLIVRNPYLSTWLGNARKAPWEDWPMFWTGARVGFSVMAAVPSTGNVDPLVSFANHPIFNLSGNRANEIIWDLSAPDAPLPKTGKTRPIKTWKVARRNEQLLTEFADRGEWGTLHFSGPGDAMHQSGISSLLRRSFAEKGSLNNKIDGAFRPIMQEEPVFAFSKAFNLGNGNAQDSTRDSAVFTFALVQDPVVQFASARGLTHMKPLWASYIPSADDLISYHYHDFETAAFLAYNYSATLAIDAFQSGSSYYQDIAALSARQVLGATQFSGTPDNPILFLKEISSNGNFQTVDVIFPAFPFFLYTNPRWLAYLLEPLLEHQLSGQYPNNYSMHDLGAHFPNATGHADGRDEYMPVEECGNMLIMGLALANAFRWLSRSYEMWKKWTGYLVRESLIPANQLCTDDFAGWLANQTNLALKGIIGIRAMSDIADLTGHDEDAKHYKQVATEYIGKWQEYGISRDRTHAKLAYTYYGSWTTLYNLYADSLLCFHIPQTSSPGILRGSNWLGQKFLGHDDLKSDRFIPDKVYQMQSDWYHAVLQRYGLPLDSRHLYTKSDWEFFAAAVTSQSTRTEMLNSIALWVNETTTDRPLTDLYDTEGTGHFPDPTFMARPVVGGHFASLALERACGGRALKALSYLDRLAPLDIDVEQALRTDRNDAHGREEDGSGEL
ncbi:hypothetical protein P8C59_000328 [Phyllachora maydis]|uniref:Glutaminase n=1 Tax=Phyllachora maydis TaxID=1825666 RepID=A0AAD9HX11_9PEZI|nr:hypothetical protein P8C59_000328 [Phyllachora maydis]